MLAKVKQALRITHNALDDEILDLIDLKIKVTEESIF